MQNWIYSTLCILFLFELYFPLQAISDCPPISSQSRNATVPNDFCAVEGPAALAWDQSGTYTDYLGNVATVTMPYGASGSVSLYSLGGTNLACNKLIRCTSSGRWVLIGECAPHAWDDVYVTTEEHGIYKYSEDWCTQPCGENCKGNCPPHTTPQANCWMESSKTYKWVKE